MSGVKISALPAVVAPALSDVFPIDQGAVTYKESGSQLLSLFQANASGTWNINISGNAETVTTNANLTGDVTSVGNATTYNNFLPLAKGGLNAALVASNGGIFYSTATAGALLSGTATAGQILRSGASAAPTWSTATYPSTAGTSGNVLTSDGTNWISSAATGGNPLTTKGDLFTFTTVDARLPVGVTNGQYLQVNSGAATGLAWSTATLPATATNVARILRSNATNWVETTSTFADTYAASGFLYANGANNVAGLATANNGLPVTSNTGVPSILAGPGSTGNILQSNAAAAPSWSTAVFPATAGANGNVLISDGTNWASSVPVWLGLAGGTMTGAIAMGGFAITGMLNPVLAQDAATKAYVDSQVVNISFTWSEQTGTTQAIAVKNGYILNNAALVTATLPATAAVGGIFELVGKGAGLFKLAQNASQTVHISGSSTTTGVGGSLTAVDRYASLAVVCITANTNFVVTSATGNFTLV